MSTTIQRPRNPKHQRASVRGTHRHVASHLHSVGEQSVFSSPTPSARPRTYAIYGGQAQTLGWRAWIPECRGRLSRRRSIAPAPQHQSVPRSPRQPRRTVHGRPLPVHNHDEYHTCTASASFPIRTPRRLRRGTSVEVFTFTSSFLLSPSIAVPMASSCALLAARSGHTHDHYTRRLHEERYQERRIRHDADLKTPSLPAAGITESPARDPRIAHMRWGLALALTATDSTAHPGRVLASPVAVARRASQIWRQPHRKDLLLRILACVHRCTCARSGKTAGAAAVTNTSHITGRHVGARRRERVDAYALPSETPLEHLRQECIVPIN